MKKVYLMQCIFMLYFSLTISSQPIQPSIKSIPQYYGNYISNYQSNTINKQEQYHNIFDNDFNKKLIYKRTLSNYIKEKMAESKTVGLSIAVVKDNRILFTDGFGYSDKAQGQVVSPFTLFKLGSISKLFTGIAIMQLVEQGHLDLDAPIDRYIPNFYVKTHYPNLTNITIRSLMTHHSGLPSDKFKDFFSNSYPPEDFTSLVDYFSGVYTAYPSNYITSYCNSGISLLGVIIENVSHMDFEDYIEQNILLPMGMILSNFVVRDYMDGFFSKGYDFTQKEEHTPYLRDIPAGDFVSSPFEMTKFIKTILNGGTNRNNQIIKKSSLEKMFTQQNLHIPIDFPKEHGMKWGLSWMLGNSVLDYAGQNVGHGGNLIYHHAMLQILPEHNMGVIVTVNSESGISIPTQVADQALILALQIFKGIKKPDLSPPAEIVPLTKEMEKLFTGTYVFNEDGFRTITKIKNSLHVNFLGLDVTLTPHKDEWMSLSYLHEGKNLLENYRLTVRKVGDEKIVGIELRDYTKDLIIQVPFGVKYEAPQNIPYPWIERVGEYICENPDEYIKLTSMRLVLDPTNVLHLYINNDFSSSSIISPQNDHEGIFIGRGRSLNETIQVKEINGEEMLYWSGFLFKKKSQKDGLRVTNSVQHLSQKFSPTEKIKKFKDMMASLRYDRLK